MRRKIAINNSGNLSLSYFKNHIINELKNK